MRVTTLLWRPDSIIPLKDYFSTNKSSAYKNVAKNHQGFGLSEDKIGSAKLQGECLVQLKELTFKRKDKFDPISEWINYRSVSLLEQYSPCEVLIMLEVANKKIRGASE